MFKLLLTVVAARVPRWPLFSGRSMNRGDGQFRSEEWLPYHSEAVKGLTLGRLPQL
jgi:hypothetical protein